MASICNRSCRFLVTVSLSFYKCIAAYLPLFAFIFMKVPYVGLNFAVYESLKDWLLQTNPLGLANDNELHVVTRLGCGAVAGTIGQTVAYPLDVIRRRMQMVGWSHADSIVTGQSKEALQYNGMIDAFRKTVRHEGVGALYKGLVPNSVKVNLSNVHFKFLYAFKFCMMFDNSEDCCY